MISVVNFIEQTALGLYIVIAAGIFWAWWRWSSARQEARSTYFELERDIYRYRQVNALTLLILLVEAGLIVLGVQQIVAPTLRQTSSTPLNASGVIEDIPFATPTQASVAFGNSPIDSSGVNLVPEDSSSKIQATDAPTPTPVGTIQPNPPPVEGCDKPGAILQIPGNGMLVFEPTGVVGTATTENFAFYRFEIKGPSTFGSFASLRDYDRPVTELGQLGQFVPAFYQPGEYQFRLTVFDITNTLKAACTVNITISEPIPTPTPIPPP